MEISIQQSDGTLDDEERPQWMQYMTTMTPNNTKASNAEPNTAIMDQRTVGEHSDEEEKPLWLRCLPSNTLIPKGESKITVEHERIDTKEKKQGWRRVTLRRSCNPFGPTSTHALTSEKSVLSTKRTRADSNNLEIEHETSNPNSIQKRVRYRRKATANICEASELFSIVKL